MSKLVAPLVLVLLIALTGAGIVYMLTREKGRRVFVQVEEIKKIAQLSTVQARLSGYSLLPVKLPKACKAIPLVGCRDAYVFAIVTGTITGSVDLKQMKVDVNQREKTVRITFPKDSIVVSEPAMSKVPDVTPIETNVPNIISSDHKTKSAQDSLDSLKQAAKNMGIEKLTAQQAVVVLTGFLKSLGYKAQIEFEDKSLEASMSPAPDRELRGALIKICEKFPGIPQCA